MASPQLEQLLGPSQWPLALVRLGKDFSFDLGLVLLLGFLSYFWFLRQPDAFLRRLFLVVPMVLIVLSSMFGMPEYWAKSILQKSDQLPREVCQGELSALVVLGGGLAGPDDLAVSSQSRVRHAVRWLNRLPQLQRERLPIILSAGPTLEGSSRSEASLMRELFQGLTHASSGYLLRIQLEERSLNTHDNAVGVAALLQERGQGQAIALVTSQLHMFRSFQTFRAVGFRVCPVASPAIEQNSEGFLNFRNGDRTVRVLNEYIGLVGYRFKGWL